MLTIQGKLKNTDFFIGDGYHISVPAGKYVRIVEEEDNPIYGKRYKIIGYSTWFGENCFECVKNNLHTEL